MHHLKPIQLNIRLVALLVVAVAAVVAVGSLPPRQAEAAGPFDLTGVICIDNYLDAPPLVTKGDPHDDAFPIASVILARIEPSTSQADGWDVTTVNYNAPDLAPADLVPDKNPADVTCKALGNGHSLNASVVPADVDVSDRPTATAKLVTKGADTNLEWTDCAFQQIPAPIGDHWVQSEFAIVVDGKQATQDFGVLTAYLDDNQCTSTPDSFTFLTVVEVTWRTATKGTPIANDDWDGDTISDWDELDRPPSKNFGGCDPFTSDNLCRFGVGGIAELAEAAGTPLEAPDSSGSNTGMLAGIVAAIAAGMVSLGGAAWYARRRWAR